MTNRIEPINFKQANERYGKLNDDEYATLWALVQLYDLDMVVSGIKLEKAECRGMEYVERYCEMMSKEDARVEEMWNEHLGNDVREVSI